MFLNDEDSSHTFGMTSRAFGMAGEVFGMAGEVFGMAIIAVATNPPVSFRRSGSD